MPPPALKLLLVEDNAGDARLLRAMLEGAEGEVEMEWVQNLDDGVQALTHGAFDAVLLDLSLPDSQGVEGVATTHLFDTETPIIVLTGLDDDHAAIEALRSGAQDYLVKGTIDGRSLLRTIRFAKQRVSFQRDLASQRTVPAQDDRDPVTRALVSPTGSGFVPAMADYAAMLRDAGHAVIYVTFDRPAEVLLRRFARQAALAGLHIVDASGHEGAADDGQVFVVDEHTDLDRVALEVERACAALGPDAHVILDSVNSLLIRHGLEQAAVFCHTMANRLRLLGISADFVGHDNQEWPFLADRLGFLDGEASLIEAGDAAPAPSDPSIT